MFIIYNIFDNKINENEKNKWKNAIVFPISIKELNKFLNEKYYFILSKNYKNNIIFSNLTTCFEKYFIEEYNQNIENIEIDKVFRLNLDKSFSIFLNDHLFFLLILIICTIRKLYFYII